MSIKILCLLGLAGVAGAAVPPTARKTLLMASGHRAPDDDHLVHEMHDNAEYKSGAAKKPVDKIEKEFVSMDRNNDGYLDTQELMFRQYATGCEPVEAQVRGHDYMLCGDLNKDGKISLEEFKKSTEPQWAHCVKDTSDRRVHGFVRFFDADADYDNKLSKTELRVGVLQLWGSPGDQLVDPLMTCTDKNKDGFMDENEFHDSICAYNPATRTWQMWNGTSDKEILTCMADAFKKFDAALVFTATDTNHDRKVSRSEAYDTMRAVNGMTLPQATADAIFDGADKDKNKYLSLDEFQTAGEAYTGPSEAPNPGFFLLGRSAAKRGRAGANATAPLDTYDEGYGMSIECHNADGAPWRLFSDAMGQVRVETTDNQGGVKVTQR